MCSVVLEADDIKDVQIKAIYEENIRKLLN